MIPLRDINPTRIRPVLTWGLIALNVVIFLYQRSRPDGGEAFIRQWGLVPYYLTSGHLGSVSTVLTSMFLHGGWGHLILNMWSLYIFGDNVEEKLGRVRYLLFYALTGFAAALAHAAVDPDSPLPMVGASGAISGVLAAYMRLFPRARIITLVPIVIFFIIREWPAWLYVVVWFGIQLLFGLGALGGSSDVAFFAHIGGFLAGLYLIGQLLPLGAMRDRAPPGPEPWS